MRKQNISRQTLTKGLSKEAGDRNNHGRLTAFRKGGGHKRKYRLVDFKRKTILKVWLKKFLMILTELLLLLKLGLL